MFCTACGFSMNEEHRYCARCGKPSADGQFQWNAVPQGPPQPPKRLERDMFNRRIAGVCSGFANYFNLDPTIMRLLWVGFTFATGVPLLLYPICWIVMARNDERALPAPNYQQA